MSKGLLRFALIAIVACAGALFLGERLGWFDRSSGTVTKTVTSSGVARIGGTFSLVDQFGKRRTDKDFRGKHMLVFFGYTHCPDFCPTSLHATTEALKLLGADAEKLRYVFITVDPERDTANALKGYAENFHKGLVALTGSEAEVAAAAKAYRVYYAKGKVDTDGDYLMDHSTFTYLMAPDGRFVTYFRHGISPEKLAEGLRKHL